MSLTDPTAKMSKSHKVERSRILITDTPEQIRSKIGSALTDSLPGVSYDTATRPGVSNLLDILSVFDTQHRTPSQLAVEYSEIAPKLLKEMVSDAVVRGLDGIRSRYLELLDNVAHLDRIEAEGAHKARQSAAETMQLVRAAVGF